MTIRCFACGEVINLNEEHVCDGVEALEEVTVDTIDRLRKRGMKPESYEVLEKRKEWLTRARAQDREEHVRVGKLIYYTKYKHQRKHI